MTYFLCGFFPHTLGDCLWQLSHVILHFPPQGVLEDGPSSNGMPRSTAPGGISNPEKKMSCGTQCSNPQSLTSGPLTQKQNGLRTTEVGDSYRTHVGLEPREKLASILGYAYRDGTRRRGRDSSGNSPCPPCEGCCKENGRTPPHPNPCLEVCYVFMNQGKWALAICTLKGKTCVCLNTSLFRDLLFTAALTVLTPGAALVTRTRLWLGGWQGSGLTGKEREDRCGRR